MKKHHFVLIVLAAAMIPPLCWAADNLPATADPAKAAEDPDFSLQGEYTGRAGDEKVGVQVIALGDGEFEAVVSRGGLPGEGWNREKPRARNRGKRGEDGGVTFTQEQWTAVVREGKLTATSSEDDSAKVMLERVERESPTLGAAAPEGAVVLFDGTAEKAEAHWQNAKLDGDLLCEGAVSKDEFRDFTAHVEFLLPWMPKARGQARGNSGFYVAGRYEVQMLDSFGLTGEDNECGGIYKVARPRENMCYPPLRWQTYDVDFTAARFDAEGNKTANARMTVKHNGVVIHDDLELPGPTGGARGQDESLPGPVFLQNHGNPVRYRNIWVLEKE